MLITALTTEEIMKASVEEHTLLLEKHIAPFSKTTRIQSMGVVGQEFIEIIKEVLRNNHDLVIKTARGMSGTTESCRLFTSGKSLMEISGQAGSSIFPAISAR